MTESIGLNPSIVNIGINIPWNAVAGGIVGYVLWTKIGNIAAERIHFLKPVVPVIAMVGALVGAAAGPAVAAIQLAVLTALTFREIYLLHPADPAGGAARDPLPEFVSDMIRAAKESSQRAFIGTEPYIGMLEIVLSRSQKRNAILLGPAGVGKTVIVEDLAFRIAHKKLDATSPLKNKRILKLDLQSFLTGSSWADGGMLVGMMEGRIKALLKFLEKNEDVIVFMDEVHMIKGSGQGLKSNNDMANCLKEALGRNGISMIGATTEKEYDAILARDDALVRRFELITVIPPTPYGCLKMIKHQKSHFKRHYPGMTLTDEAIKAAIFFASRDCINRQPLDAAMDLIDNAHVSHRRGAMKRAENVNGPALAETTIDVGQIFVAHAAKMSTHPKPSQRYTAEELCGQFNALNRDVYFAE